MKHVVKQRKPSAKSKTKSLASVKSAAKTSPAAKKSNGKAASDSRMSEPVQKAESRVTSAIKPVKDSAKASLQKSAAKLSVKTLDALETISKRQSIAKNKTIENPKTNKSASKASTKTAETLSVKDDKKINRAPQQKSDLTRKTKDLVIEKKISEVAIKQKTSPKVVAEPKKTGKNVAQNEVKTAKRKNSQVTIQKASPRLKSAHVSATSETKIVSPNIKNAPKIEKIKSVSAKSNEPQKIAAPIVKVKTVKENLNQISIGEPKKAIGKKLPAKSDVAATKDVAKKLKEQSGKPKTEANAESIGVKEVEFTPVAPTENIVWKRLKFKPAIASAKSVKSPAKMKKQLVAEPIAPIAVVETIKLPAPKPKKGKPIGSAVFRGKNERYDFKVFEINENLDPIPAVYIISKRKIDRNKKGHHAVVCIGQTASIFDELKRHRKSKCVKKHAANVVSILTEADEKTRIQIETDLKAAHNIVCNFE